MILLLSLTFDRLALVVEDKAFTLSEIRREALFYPGASLSQIIEILLEEELLLLEAEEETITVSHEEIEDALKRMKENIPQDEWLRNLSVIKEKIRRQLIIQKLMQKKGLPVITDMDALRFYQEKRESLFIPEKVSLERYSIPLISSDREKKKREAERFYHGLKKGEGWDEMKDMGWMDKKELPPEFRKVEDMEVGDITIVEASDGFYVIACTGKRGDYIKLSIMPFVFEFTQDDYERGKKKAEEIRKDWMLGKPPEGIEDMGEIPLDALTPLLASIIDTIPEGKISEPIFDAGRFYLIKVKERKEKEFPPFEMIKDRIKNILFSREMEKKYRKEVEELKEKYYVKIPL